MRICVVADNVAPTYYQPYLPGIPVDKRGGKDSRGHALSGLVPVVSINCSAVPECGIDGLTMIAVAVNEGGRGNGPAVRVFTAGDPERARGVHGVTVMSGQLTGGTDVVDERSQPVGAWAARSAGGWTLVAESQSPVAPMKAREQNKTVDEVESQLTAVGGWSTATHALLVGQTGERGARLALEGDGSVRYADGSARGFHTTVLRHRANSSSWDPPAVPAGKWTSTEIALRGAQVGDIVTCTCTQLGEFAMLMSARVVRGGIVKVFLKNEEEKTVDLPSGRLRVATVQYAH
jgi:hypothetical protein